MRAVFYKTYGPPAVLRVRDVERPAPKPDEVLVRVHASTVTRTDCGVRAAKPWFARLFTGLVRPKRKVPGIEFAGEVEEIGLAVTEFAVGDRVFGVKGGANAEYVCVREAGAIAPMPVGIGFEEAAAVCDGAALALACLHKVQPLKGRSVLVYGATGSVGTATVQLARYFGADLTAVGNTKNLELVRSLGADRVIDYTQEDFTKNGATYDVIVDTSGVHSFGRGRGALKPGGMYIATDGLRNALWALRTWKLGDKKATLGVVKYRKEDVVFLKELIEGGKYRAVIDRCYPLEDVVDATRYVETGQKTGNVVLRVRP